MTIATSPSTDLELLRQHWNGSADAFTELTRRHVDMVYSAALRQLRDPHLADDVTQAVFLLLWQKASSLDDNTILPAWLHRTTRYCAANAIRLRTIRQRHEQRAAQMSSHESDAHESNPAEDAELAAVLDRAVAKLPATDRDAVIMRYFEGKSADDVAVSLRVSPDAARKRIERAVIKLRKILSRLGVQTAAPSLTAFLTSRAIVHSPGHVVASIHTTIAAASAGSATAATSAAGVIAKGALVAMSVKTQWATAAILILLLVGAIGTYVVMSPGPATTTAVATTAPAANVIRVQAYIDGRSQLQIRGNTAQWLNLEYNVPGTHGNTSRPTIINGRQWYPTFLNAPIGTRSLSDQFDQVAPTLPSAPLSVTVHPITARGVITIAQQPSAKNQYTLIVEFDDSVAAGAADYTAEITFTPVSTTTKPAAIRSLGGR